MDPSPDPLRISESKHRLTVRDAPGALWLLGLGFVASGTLVLSIPFYSTAWRHFALWERAAVLVIGLGHLCAGLYTTLRPAATRTDFDQTTDTGLQHVRRLWPRRVFVARFSLADIRAVEIVPSADGDGDPMFQLRLWLTESRTVWLQAQPSHGEERARENAARLRRFLGLCVVDETTAP